MAVVAVVFVHAYNLSNRLLSENAEATPHTPHGVVGFVQYLGSQTLTRWPAALLFAISGFLFFHNLEPRVGQFVSKIRRRARTLALPYLLWSSWSLAVYVVSHALPSAQAYVSADALNRLTIGSVLERLFVSPVAYPLWFLQALFTCALLSPAIWALVRFLGPLALAPFTVAWLLHVDLGAAGYLPCKALLFFTLGALVATRMRAGQRVPFSGPNGSATSAALGRWLLPLFVAACILYTALLRNEQSWAAATAHQLLMCLAVAAVWFGYDAYLIPLVRRRWLTASATLSFFVFAAQEPLLMIFKRLILHTGGGGRVSDAVILATYFAAPLLTIAVSLAAGWMLRRHARPLYGLLTGGR